MIQRLTLTWDVLKCKTSTVKGVAENMININMRCIEMYPKLLGDAVTARLTLTWDVLK